MTAREDGRRQFGTPGPRSFLAEQQAVGVSERVFISDSGASQPCQESHKCQKSHQPNLYEINTYIHQVSHFESRRVDDLPLPVDAGRCPVC